MGSEWMYCPSLPLRLSCETIESFSRNFSSESKGNFDFFMAFHCLEHVSDPKWFVASLTELMRQLGREKLKSQVAPDVVLVKLTRN